MEIKRISGAGWKYDKFGMTDDINICIKYDEIHCNDIDICKEIKKPFIRNETGCR